MTRKFVRWLSVAFFLVYTIVLIYPGVLPFNRIRPLVFGLPFSFFWVALWVASSGLVLWLLYSVDERGG